MARNRIIYQSEGLYTGPTSGTSHTEVLDNSKGVATLQDAGAPTRNGATPLQLHRIQSINYGFDIPRQDVNQFGQLARIDQVILEQPTVDLDFTYYTETGFNDRQLGFHVGGRNTLGHFISGEIGKVDSLITVPGSNFYIRTSKEGDDLNRGTDLATDDIIGIGNAFITNWSTEASVGSFPTTSVTAEGLNMRFYTEGAGTVGANSNAHVPAVKPTDGANITSNFKLPAASEETDAAMPTALKPGSIHFAGDILDDEKLWRGLKASDLKIQSFSISADMSRENLEKLGSRFAYSKELEFPLSVTLTMEAICGSAFADNLATIVGGTDNVYGVTIAIKDSPSAVYSDTDGTQAIAYKLKGLKTDSLSFSSAIGDNKSVSLTATAQIGAGDDTTNGLFIYAKGVKIAD